jgi:hypothetical protein
MNKISTAIVDVEREIAELRDGRGSSRAALSSLLRRVLDALWEQHCPCEKESCKYPLCHANKSH